MVLTLPSCCCGAEWWTINVYCPASNRLWPIRRSPSASVSLPFKLRYSNISPAVLGGSLMLTLSSARPSCNILIFIFVACSNLDILEQACTAALEVYRSRNNKKCERPDSCLAWNMGDNGCSCPRKYAFYQYTFYREISYCMQENPG